MNKKAQVVKYMIALIIAVIVIWVIIQIFTQQTSKSAKGLSELSEEAKINASKCSNFILGRACKKESDCPAERLVPGFFDDCKQGEVCCET